VVDPHEQGCARSPRTFLDRRPDAMASGHPLPHPSAGSDRPADVKRAPVD
jgi:hypothetical protein